MFDPTKDHCHKCSAELPDDSQPYCAECRMGLPDTISITWGISDVKEVRPDLTDKQAREVLSEAKRKHDASIGINWEVLEVVAEYLFPKSV